MLKRWSQSNLGERAQVRRILKDSNLEEQSGELAAPLLAMLGVQNEETAKVNFEQQKETLIRIIEELRFDCRSLAHLLAHLLPCS